MKKNTTLKSLILFSLIFISICGFSQVSGDYRTAGTGSWSTLGTWVRYKEYDIAPRKPANFIFTDDAR